MKEIKQTKNPKELILKPQGNPLTDGLSPYLKNQANFKTIMKMVIDSVQTKCFHNDVIEMAGCKICSEKMLERRKLLKKLGFKNPRQFMGWRRIHEEIVKRYPLVDWKKPPEIII